MATPNINSTFFLNVFDEFKKENADKLAVYLQLASNRVPPSVWGVSTQYATALLAAHMLATSGRQGGGPAGGAMTQEQVADLSRSFQFIGEIGSGDAPLMTTRYGIDFVALRKETLPTAMPARKPGFPAFPGGCA